MDHSMEVCIYCKSSVPSSMLYVHIVHNHRSVYIRCSLEKCAGNFFTTSQDLNKHIKEDHKEEGNVYPQGEPHNLSKKRIQTKKNGHGNTKGESDEDTCKELPALPIQDLSVPATDSMVTCNFCLNKFNQSKIIYHITDHHKGDAFQCKPCKSFFNSPSDLKSHRMSNHGPNAPSRPSKCIYCYKHFNSRNTMYQHVRKIHLDVMIKCCIKGCGELFRIRPEMAIHYERRHAPELLKKSLQCEHCPYRASTKKLIKKHVTLNHLPKNFACGLCPKKFATQSKAAIHKSIRHVSKRECGHCKRSYTYYTYNAHLKKASCKFCRTSLPCSKALRMHEVTCKITQRMSCGKCRIVFKNKFELREHKFSCQFDVERYTNYLKINVKSLESLT